MKEEVRKAIQTLKDRANRLAFDTDTFGLYTSDMMIAENSQAVATIERALTDTTLEIVKRKLAETLEKIKIERAIFDETVGNGLIYGVLVQIITEAESTK